MELKNEENVSAHMCGSGEKLMKRQVAGKSQTDRRKLAFVRL